MDWEEIILTLVLDLILTVFFYLLVPIIFCIRKKPMTEKQIKKITIINGIVVWLVFSIIISSVDEGISSVPAAFLWSWIGKMIMERVLLEDEESKNRLYECKSCGYRNQEYFDACPQCGNHTKQYAYINDEKKQEISPNVSEIEISTNEPTSQGKCKYCSQCGGLINNKTKVCEGCGKQYFKGFSSKIIVMIIIAILLVVSIVISLILHIQNTKLNDRIEELEIENQQYYDYWVESFEQIAFFDEFVVFVEDDGTNWYHKYECRRFTGNDFWAFNIDAAIIDGYKPCPFCCE